MLNVQQFDQAGVPAGLALDLTVLEIVLSDDGGEVAVSWHHEVRKVRLQCFDGSSEGPSQEKGANTKKEPAQKRNQKTSPHEKEVRTYASPMPQLSTRCSGFVPAVERPGFR
eukprot:11290691-Alexandrium_andersonii.AAC.1